MEGKWAIMLVQLVNLEVEEEKSVNEKQQRICFVLYRN
jgi:hypothetical protein